MTELNLSGSVFLVVGFLPFITLNVSATPAKFLLKVNWYSYRHSFACNSVVSSCSF